MAKKIIRQNFWRLALIGSILLAGFVLRLLLVNRIIVGDLLAYLEWGQRIWEWGTKSYYWGEHAWTYSPPNYPPLAALVYGGIDWLYRHRYWWAQLHNLIKIPPAAFIVYFYKYGDVLLYKLLPILADLGLGIIAYKLVFRFTNSFKKAVIGLALVALNPITIFVSGAWGQTDSLVAFFGLSAFIVLADGKVLLAAILFFVSMYLKPNWGLFAPLLLYLTYLKKPKISTVLLAGVVVAILVTIVSAPFAENGVIVFTKRMWFDKYIIPVKSVGKASISAFNFHTIFLRIDRDFFNAKYLGIIAADKLGLIFYLLLNVFSFSYLRKCKNILWGTLVGIWTIGLGSFLLMSNMLERYFFPALVPLVVIMLVRVKTLFSGLIINLILFANLIWAFFRRGSDEIDHPFTNNNFLLIRTISLLNVYLFWLISRKVYSQTDADH